jgi:hypothetical protein
MSLWISGITIKGQAQIYLLEYKAFSLISFTSGLGGTYSSSSPSAGDLLLLSGFVDVEPAAKENGFKAEEPNWKPDVDVVLDVANVKPAVEVLSGSVENF